MVFALRLASANVTHVNIFIVSCALNDPKHDYSRFWAAIEAAGAKRAMDTVWLFETSQSLEEVTVATLSHLSREDRLFVSEVGRWAAVRLLDDAGPWLLKRRPLPAAGPSKTPPSGRQVS